MTHVLATQVMAMKRPKSMRARLDGRLGPHVSSKDLALRLIADLGVSGARGYVVEYAGSAARAMPIEQRMTLCNLNIEMGGRSGFVAPDDTTFAWLAKRPYLPQGEMWDRALAFWHTLKSDDEATFNRDVTLDCSTLEPQITWGYRSEPGCRYFRPCPRARRARSKSARRGGKCLHLYGPQTRHAARRIAGQSRFHRLLHQQPVARS
jgi:homoaconitase/3-isopropylmalate dehydratase large subunit